MSDHNRPADAASHASDDELLASALPIDETGESDVLDDDAYETIDLEDGETEEAADGSQHERSSKIKLISDRGSQTERNWQRQPHQTGEGAVRVKTFVAKFRTEAIQHMDEQINDWLEAHPEYEVKFVSSSVGALKGKETEDALVVNVWV